MGRASLLPLPPCAQDSGCQVRASKYQRAAGRAVTVPSLPLTNIEPRGGSSSSRMLAEKPFRLRSSTHSCSSSDSSKASAKLSKRLKCKIFTEVSRTGERKISNWPQCSHGRTGTWKQPEVPEVPGPETAWLWGR